MNNNNYPLHNEAQQLSKFGEGEDKILAHINPQEAQMLQEMFGSDINSETGLPQFGLFKSIGRMFRNPLKVVGAILGGPIGMTIGGQIGPKDRRDHLGMSIGNLFGPAGTVIGAQFGPKDRRPTGSQIMGNALMSAAMTAGGMHGMGMSPFGQGGPLQSLGNIFGGGQGAGGSGSASGGGMFGNLGNIFGGNAVMSNNFLPQGPGTMLPPGVGGGGGMFGGMGGLSKFMLPLLAASAFGRKEKAVYDRTPEEIANRELEIYRRMQAGINPPSDYKPKKRKPKDRYYGYDDNNPTEEYFEEDKGYKRGGFVKGGFIDGNSSGQADNLKKHIPNKSYIMNATDVSLLGDGNTKKGKKVLDKFVSKYAKGGDFVNVTDQYQFTPVYLSAGEYSIRPEIIKKIGNGNIDEGAKKMDKFRKNLRAHKGVKNILPPKTKSLESYF